jgi:sugar-phosphatase
MTLIYCIPPRASLKRRPHSTIGFVLLAPNISKLVIEKRVTTFRSAAILFDLDGVLVDSTGSVDRQWRLWARERGIAEEKVIAIAHGVRAVEVIRSVAPHLNAEAEVRALEKREAADRDGVAVMPGAVDLVHRIPEGLWCVVTSGSRYLATGRLRLAGIPVPQVMVTADDVVNGKPHPEPYLKGAELLKVDPKECLVIEDAPAGIVSAHAAGMKVLALTSTYAASALSSADAVIVKLDQIQVAADGTRKLTIEIDET